MKTIDLKTSKRSQLIDITSLIQTSIDASGFKDGIILVYSPHTTAGITINENADPDVRKDINNFLGKLVPQSPSFAHSEGNSDAHIKGSLINFSQNIIVENGKLQLGTWQGIYFAEFDGPRQRQVWLKFISEK